MISKPTKNAASIIVSAAVASYGLAAAGKDYVGPSPQTLLNIATTSFTGSTATVVFNPTTFAKVEAPPAVEPILWKRTQL